jgi:excinuclease ABC subunit B
MYADMISEAMRDAIEETSRRRKIQEAYNEEHGIVPKTIVKEIREVISNVDESVDDKTGTVKMSKKEKQNLIIKIEEEMKLAAKNLDFEKAMELRDILFELKSE